MAAPWVPALRATAVADAAKERVGPAPSTCMIATAIEWRPVAVKLTPAIVLFVTEIVKACPEGSPNVQLADAVPIPAQVGAP